MNTIRKFTLIKDFNKNFSGDTLTSLDGESYFFENDTVKYPIHFIESNTDLFKEDKNLEVSSFLDTEDTNDVYDWRIELKVKCSKKKLFEIERLIKETIAPLL